MIRKDLAVDAEALEGIKEAIQELLVRFPLCGFSLLGESVEVRDTTHERPEITTLATDGRNIWYCPAWINSKTARDRVFDLLHEWLHVFNNHVDRVGTRDPKVWNVAADMYVNHTVVSVLSDTNDPWTIPSDAVPWEAWAEGLTVEAIYDKLIENKADLPTSFNKDLVPPKSPFANESEKEEWLVKFRDDLAQAVLMQTELSGKPLPESIRSRIAKVLKNPIPWERLLLGKVLDAMGQDVPTWARPRRRLLPQLIVPSYRALKERRLVIAVDVSASVTEVLIRKFISSVTGAAMRAQETHVIVFDAKVREHFVTRSPQKILSEVKFLTGSHDHTSVKGVFKLVDEIDPSGVVVLTDGYVSLPEKSYPETIWVIPENGRSQSWGKTFVMEHTW